MMTYAQLQESISSQARQSAVARAGNRWEKYVVSFLEESLARIREGRPEVAEVVADIAIEEMGQIREIQALRLRYPRLYRSLFIPALYFAKERDAFDLQHLEALFARGAVGDTDIVVFARESQVPIAVVSCKLSLHGRLTETLFYSLYFRITNKVRHVLATPDKGTQASARRWRSEWGTPEEPSKNRLLATLFLDGVYVDHVETFMPAGFRPGRDRTALGGIVRDMVELPFDLVRWYGDVKFAVME